MPESQIIKDTSQPNTLSTLIHQLQVLGLRSGDIVIVHSSLNKMGWTVGGPVAVIDALQRVLSPGGTLVMPTHSNDNSEPSYWENPPVPKAWWKSIRDEMPAFRPEVTPTRGMGVIPEVFRSYPNVLRSNHPAFSFAAWGKEAATIISDHRLEEGLGEASPLGKLYTLDAKILLLGVDHSNNTSLHLAEHRATYPSKAKVKQGAAWMVAGQRRWVEWEELNYNEDDFQELGVDYEASIAYRPGKLGKAEARYHFQRQIVDFAVGWLSARRKQAPSE